MKSRRDEALKLCYIFPYPPSSGIENHVNNTSFHPLCNDDCNARNGSKYVNVTIGNAELQYWLPILSSHSICPPGHTVHSNPNHKTSTVPGTWLKDQEPDTTPDESRDELSLIQNVQGELLHSNLIHNCQFICVQELHFDSHESAQLLLDGIVLNADQPGSSSNVKSKVLHKPALQEASNSAQGNLDIGFTFRTGHFANLHYLAASCTECCTCFFSFTFYSLSFAGDSQWEIPDPSTLAIPERRLVIAFVEIPYGSALRDNQFLSIDTVGTFDICQKMKDVFPSLVRMGNKICYIYEWVSSYAAMHFSTDLIHDSSTLHMSLNLMVANVCSSGM